MNVLITGICGFVGHSIARGLLERQPGVRLTGMDNLMRPGAATNLESLRRAGVKFVHGDLRCASDFDALPRVDWVIDAAAQPSVLAGVDGSTSSRQLVEHNLLGTINVLEYVKRCAAGLVLLSTSRVYSIPALAGIPLQTQREAFTVDEQAGVTGKGALPRGCSALGIAEEFTTGAPVSLYGATKLASEALAQEYSETFKFPAIINRCGVLAGPGQFGTAQQGIFSYWVHAYAARRPLKYIGFGGQGRQVRDALHPRDLLDLLQLQMENPTRARGVWNVGGGKANAMSLAQLSGWCARRFGEHAVAADALTRTFDVPWVVMDARRAEQAFGWKVKIGMTEMLEQIARHFEANPHWLDMTAPG